MVAASGKGDAMLIWRLFGGVLAACGGALMAFLWSELFDRSGRTLLIQQVGIPGDLLLGLVGLCSILIGLHLLVRPAAALAHASPPKPRPH